MSGRKSSEACGADAPPAPAVPPAAKPRLTINLCNIPAWALSDVAFQDNPSALRIGTVREVNRRLFIRLDAEADARRRGQIFHEYLSVQFALHQWPHYENASRRSLRNSYVRYLRGWSADSNSVEGAVLKGWVASRMGLPPTFHNGPLVEGGAAWQRYMVDRVRGMSHTNGIEGQLDLLYEFTQYELRRRHGAAQRWITLYRGTFDGESYPGAPGSGSGRPVVTLNNLSSFTGDRECAWEFGSTVWEVRVPLPKIFFFSGSLPESILEGEQEYLVVGGDYAVKKLLY